MLFKVKKGTHYGRGGKVYKKGDSVESSRDLASVFSKEKFERDYAAEQKVGVAVVDKPNIPLPVAEVKESKEDDVKEFGEYGEDVTSEFPTADKVEVMVFGKSKWYTVVDKADGEVLNEKKLRRKEVEPFLEQYLNDDTDED